MDIYALEAFKVIAETGSLTRAAERLHVSQPAMSAALKKFEAELGAPLFDREANRIRLNAAGELALERVNAVLRAVEKLRAARRGRGKRSASPFAIRACAGSAPRALPWRGRT